MPPLEDCRSGCVLHGLFSLPASPAKVATHPSEGFQQARRMAASGAEAWRCPPAERSRARLPRGGYRTGPYPGRRTGLRGGTLTSE
jgi:hypothetical protein